MPAPGSHPEDVALSLTLAVVTACPSPLLLLDGDLAIVAASTSFREAFGLRQAPLTGLSLHRLAGGTWNIPRLRRLLDASLVGDAPGDSCELDVKPARMQRRHLVVHARRLDYLDLNQTRVLVAISDVTEARADAARKAEEARRNAILLQEVRHRVANSLQIIASVLLQNARKTPSEETHGHLMNAHNRVMSVAALERLLSTSQEGDVDVHAYFTSLCENITASMIGDSGRVTLTVDGGHGVVDARVSVSLGLIVTELVINALKYAFPDGRPGRITVDYNRHGPNWILCVRDDGVGMPNAGPVPAGVGTSIVEALARQLNASVTVLPGGPGAKVSIEHRQIALAHDEPEDAPGPVIAAESGGAPRQVKEDRS